MAKKIATRRFSSPFLIGLFIIVGSFVLIALIIWLGASQLFTENQSYVTYFDTSVEGLETGSPVKYQGVPVGTIDAIHVAPDGKLIEVVMKIEKDIDIDSKLRIKAEYAGIAGGKFLQLFYPTEPDVANIYPKLNFEPKYPVIRSAPSGIERMETAVRDIITDLQQFRAKDISDATLRLLNNSNQFFENKQLYDIVANLNKSSLALHSFLANLDTSGIAQNIAATSRNFYETSNRLEKFTDSLNRQIANLNLKYKLDNAFAQIDTTLATTKSTVSNLGYRGESLLYGISETLEQLKVTNRQIRKTLRGLSDNPTAVFFSDPPPKEK
jgi:ABC-type transporter Mla subunit MlaD